MILTVALYWLLAGITEKAFVSSIIGGKVVSNKEFPWLVLLSATYFSTEDNEFHIRNCGATLIDEVWLLTAAHCFCLKNNNLIPADQWLATFEAKTIGTSISGLYFDIYNYIKTGRNWLDKQTTIEKTILYPYFNKSDYHYYDIALVKIPAVFQRFQLVLNPYILPSSSTDEVSLVGKICNSYGWGCTEFGGEESLTAMKGRFPIQANTACAALKGDMRENKICAGVTNGSIGICKGDSGSPLVCILDGAEKVVGISSYVSSDTPSYYPAAFTKVSSYLDWIQNVISSGK